MVARASCLRPSPRLRIRRGSQGYRAPTLIISTRDDGYGTFASAQYTASRIPGAKFIGFDHGGHVWVGHDDEVRAEMLKLLSSTRSL